MVLTVANRRAKLLHPTLQAKLALSLVSKPPTTRLLPLLGNVISSNLKLLWPPEEFLFYDNYPYTNYMTTHVLRLHAQPFSTIAAGNKTIEARLLDTKRQLIGINDHLIFINRDDPTQKLVVTVTELLPCHTFRELFSRAKPSEFGGTSEEELLAHISSYYSSEDEIRYGVLGIRFQVDI